ncbi:MAG: effector-associated domain EAD1-containing protein [Saprospiraceae bacterium]
MNVILTGQQIEVFQNALIAAFPSYDAQKRMLRFQLNKRLEEIVGTGALKKITFDLIETAETEGWLYELLQGARKQNTGNPQLIEFEQSIGLAIRTFNKEEIEAKIRKFDEFLSLNDWLPKLLAIEKQVCRIELANAGFGTGFLVAPNVILTNYHVVEDVIKKTLDSSAISLRFDFKKLQPNRTDLEGKVYTLAKNWLVGYDTYETIAHLDYALLRLQETPEKRGFINMPDLKGDFSANYRKDAPLFIVQHPEGAPLKLALDTESIIEINKDQSRLYYKTITEPGSSGSPCFNSQWDLIALHRSGLKDVKNGGVPIIALMKDWEKKGLNWKNNFQE